MKKVGRSAGSVTIRTLLACTVVSVLGAACGNGAVLPNPDRNNAAGYLTPKNVSGVEVPAFENEIVNFGVNVDCERVESVKLLAVDFAQVSPSVKIVNVSLVKPSKPGVAGIGASYGDVATENPGAYDIVPVAGHGLSCGKSEWEILIVLKAIDVGRHKTRGVDVRYEALGQARTQRIDFEAVIEAKTCPRSPCSSIPEGGYSPRPT